MADGRASIETKTEQWNFRVFLLQGSLRDLTNLIASANLVFPYLLTALGGPVFVAGLLMPLVTGLRFVAQLVAAPMVQGSRHHKWYIAAAALVTSGVLVALAVASGQVSVGGLVVVFVGAAVITGLAGGLSDLSFHDMLGFTLPDRRRTVLLYVQSGISGLLAIVITVITAFVLDFESALRENLELVWLGALITLLSAGVIMATRETVAAAVPRPGAHGGVLNRVRASFEHVAVLSWFRRYLVARVLFLSIELAMPFYAIHGATLYQDYADGLSVFVMASSAGAMVGALVWPALARFSVRLVMGLMATLAVAAGVVAIAVSSVADWHAAGLHALIFFLIGSAGQGIIVARTLYIIGAASDDDRPYCLAVGNIVAGIAAIVGGSILAAADTANSLWPILAIVVLNVATALFVVTLPEIQAKPQAASRHDQPNQGNPLRP